jgi:hypothetical protein
MRLPESLFENSKLAVGCRQNPHAGSVRYVVTQRIPAWGFTEHPYSLFLTRVFKHAPKGRNGIQARLCNGLTTQSGYSAGMEAFAIIGFSLGALGFIFGMSAKQQAAELKVEIEKLKSHVGLK